MFLTKARFELLNQILPLTVKRLSYSTLNQYRTINIIIGKIKKKLTGSQPAITIDWT